MLVPKKSLYQSRWFFVLAAVTSAVGALALTIYARKNFVASTLQEATPAKAPDLIKPPDLISLRVSLQSGRPMVEYGGFVSAKSAGFYRAENLEVVFTQQRPQSFAAQYLIAGTFHFHVGPAADAFAAAQKQLSVKAVAAFLQNAMEGTFYGGVVLSSQKQIDEESAVVRRFLKASAKGWQSYFLQPEKAHEAMLQEFPNLSQAELSHQFEILRSAENFAEKSVENSGEKAGEKPALGSSSLRQKLNFGTTSQEGWSETFGKFAKTTDVRGDYSPQDAFTLEFNNSFGP